MSFFQSRRCGFTTLPSSGGGAAIEGYLEVWALEESRFCTTPVSGNMLPFPADFVWHISLHPPQPSSENALDTDPDTGPEWPLGTLVVFHSQFGCTGSPCCGLCWLISKYLCLHLPAFDSSTPGHGFGFPFGSLEANRKNHRGGGGGGDRGDGATGPTGPPAVRVLDGRPPRRSSAGRKAQLPRPKDVGGVVGGVGLVGWGWLWLVGGGILSAYLAIFGP